MHTFTLTVQEQKKQCTMYKLYEIQPTGLAHRLKCDKKFTQLRLFVITNRP